jgi:hypothetical protein
MRGILYIFLSEKAISQKNPYMIPFMTKKQRKKE